MSTAIESLRSHAPDKLNAAAAEYVATKVDVITPYQAKGNAYLSRNDVIDVASARVYLLADSALVVAKTGVRAFNDPKTALDRFIDLTVRFEGAGLDAFAAGIEAAINPPMPTGQPDVVVR